MKATRIALFEGRRNNGINNAYKIDLINYIADFITENDTDIKECIETKDREYLEKMIEEYLDVEIN